MEISHISKSLVEDEAAVDVLGMCISAHPLFDSASLALYESGECDRNQKGWISYIHIGVGSKRCSFNQTGQCESLHVWDE